MVRNTQAVEFEGSQLLIHVVQSALQNYNAPVELHQVVLDWAEVIEYFELAGPSDFCVYFAEGAEVESFVELVAGPVYSVIHLEAGTHQEVTLAGDRSTDELVVAWN